MGFVNGRVVEVVLRATAGSDEQVNSFVYDLQPGTAGDNNDPQSLADTFRDDVRDVWGSLYSAAWTLEPVVVTEVKDPQNPTAPRQSWTSGSPTPGTKTVSGDLLPPQCQVLVALTTDHIGKRFRGRLWLGGSVLESEQANGVWATGYLSGIATVLAAIPHQPDISPPADTSTADWSVFSRTQRGPNPGNPGGLNPYLSHIQAATARTLVHTLRSRALY